MNRRSMNEVIDILSQHGYTYVDGEYKNPYSKLTCTDSDGYYVFGCLDKLVNRGHNFPVVHVSNPYSIDNIKRMVNEFTDGEFDCISNEYKGNNKELNFRHNVCGRTFKNKWINIARGRYKSNASTNKTGLFCPHCQTKQLESMHALVLKQVWLHEEPDTVVEDGSCCNPETSRQLPTDIVNHRLKIAIEIQSWFHDKEKQKRKDAVKREYWINKGYDFYAIDHRDYTILEMIQMFFPYIKNIPDYIDYDYSNKFDTIKAQKLLDEYNSVSYVAELLGCSPHKIYDSIYSGLMHYPDGYHDDGYTAVVQLDLCKNFMCSYNTIKLASDKTGVSASGISGCLNNGRNYSGGYYWVYKDKYDSGDYIIKEYRSAKFLVPIEQCDSNGNLIKKFETIIDAANESGASRYRIYQVANGERRLEKGYVWKFV